MTVAVPSQGKKEKRCTNKQEKKARRSNESREFGAHLSGIKVLLDGGLGTLPPHKHLSVGCHDGQQRQREHLENLHLRYKTCSQREEDKEQNGRVLLNTLGIY